MKDMIGGVPLTRAERLGKAHEHEQLMVAKYRTGELAEPGTERVPDNYHLWQEVIEYVDNEGNNRKRTHRDYPLPYTDGRYFRRFLELFLCHGAETGLTYKLSKEFTGDDVDSDYVEQLLITAEEYRLFEDDAAICFYGDDDYSTYRPSQYRPPQAGVFNSILNGVPMYDIIVGSEANKSRRDMIRVWFKRRANELSQVTPPLPVSLMPKTLKSVCTLESICKRGTEAERKELADKIDAVWNATRQKTANEEHYPAICTAVYKLVEWLGLVDNGTVARQWKYALLSRYGVTVSDGIGKYSVNRPVSGVFKQAVKHAFTFISTTYPNWTKNRHLPAIYQ